LQFGQTSSPVQKLFRELWSRALPQKNGYPTNSSMSAGEVLMDDAPVFALFGKDVCAALVNFMTAAELHGPVKGRDGGSTVHGHMWLFDAVGEFGGALQVIGKSFAESAEAANPFVLGRREADESTVKHLQRATHITVVDGADLGTFELKDLLTSGFWHGTPPGVR
jgi:hypothetical protein